MIEREQWTKMKQNNTSDARSLESVANGTRLVNHRGRPVEKENISKQWEGKEVNSVFDYLVESDL